MIKLIGSELSGKWKTIFNKNAEQDQVSDTSGSVRSQHSPTSNSKFQSIIPEIAPETDKDDQDIYEIEVSPETRREIIFSQENEKLIFKNNSSYFEQDEDVGNVWWKVKEAEIEAKIKKNMEEFDETKNPNKLRITSRTKSASPSFSLHQDKSFEENKISEPLKSMSSSFSNKLTRNHQPFSSYSSFQKFFQAE